MNKTLNIPYLAVAAVAGANSEGFSTTQLPAAMAPVKGISSNCNG